MHVHNLTFLVFGTAGMVLQAVGSVLIKSSYDDRLRSVHNLQVGLGISIVILGSLLVGVGAAFLAVGKNRRPWFGLLGLASPVGLLFLAVLQNRTGMKPDGPHPSTSGKAH